MRALIVGLAARAALAAAASGQTNATAPVAARSWRQGFECDCDQLSLHPALYVDAWGPTADAACAAARAHCPRHAGSACIRYGPSPCASVTRNVCADHTVVDRQHGP